MIIKAQGYPTQLAPVGLFDGRLYHRNLLELTSALPPPVPGVGPLVAGFAVPAAPAAPVGLIAPAEGLRDLVFVKQALLEQVRCGGLVRASVLAGVGAWCDHAYGVSHLDGFLVYQKPCYAQLSSSLFYSAVYPTSLQLSRLLSVILYPSLDRCSTRGSSVHRPIFHRGVDLGLGHFWCVKSSL